MAVVSSFIPGFGLLGISDFTVNGFGFSVNFAGAIQNAVLMRTTQGASTVTLQLQDPERTILRSGSLLFGCQLVVNGLIFSLVAITKAGTSLQITFESTPVANLRTKTGFIATTQTSDLASFARILCAAVPGIQLIAQTSNTIVPITVGRGTATDATEDSWSALIRISATAGWRCFESGGIIFLGSDAWLQALGSLAPPFIISEFTPSVHVIDFDYNIGKPFGTVTVTCETDNLFVFSPGSTVWTSGMGPLDGHPWLVQSIQRNIMQSQATCTLYAPMSEQNLVTPPATPAPF